MSVRPSVLHFITLIGAVEVHKSIVKMTRRRVARLSLPPPSPTASRSVQPQAKFGPGYAVVNSFSVFSGQTDETVAVKNHP